MNFEIIKNWIIENKDSLIVELVIFCFFWLCGKLFLVGKKIPALLKTILKIKLFKFIEVILLYFFPIIFIIISILDDTTKPTYKSICIFIIICVTLIFNILMNKIIGIYKMISQLTKMNSEKLTLIDNEFGVVYKIIQDLKSKTNK